MTIHQRRTLRVLAILAWPASLAAQAQVISDPMPAKTIASSFAGARLMRSGVVSQFDSLGSTPMGSTGDPVTVYLFPDGDHLRETIHARITRRQRFQPPSSWRAACDEIAHPGWFYAVTPESRAPFAVIVPGVWPAPVAKALPPAAKDGAWQFFRAVADSSWQRYRDFLKPATDRAVAYLHNDFWGPTDDARWNQLKMFGVRGPNGSSYAAFSFAMHDDYPNRPNSARTWVVDAWGFPVASIPANIDIYGTIDEGGIDAIVTSSGLIHWDGTGWVFPAVYSEEPCLFHKVMDPPAGYKPAGGDQ